MRFVLVMAILCAGGCNRLTRSRWAMDNELYAEKYREGADQWDPWGKVKQAMDARFTAGHSGLYVAGGAQVRPETGAVVGGAEIGGENYLTSWSSARASLGIYGAEDEGYGGIDLGIRAQTPTRLAPFVGVGTFQGVSRTVKNGEFNWIDDDEDGFIDEPGEQFSSYDGWLSAVYPEVGLHFWFTSEYRISAFGRYYITNLGRDSDTWVLGLQFNGFSPRLSFE